MKFQRDSDVRKLAPPAGKSDHTFWDDSMPGFGVRFRNGGPGNYIIQYRVNNRTGRMGLGPVQKVTLEDAKKRARDAFNLIADKVDPAVERAKQATKNIPFKSKIDTYLDFLAKRGRGQKYIDDVKRSLNDRFSALHKFAFPEMDRGMIAVELGRIETARGTGAMRNSRAHINAYLTWAFKEGLIESNPAAATHKPPSVKRDRILTPEDEIRPLWKLLLAKDKDFEIICKLLWLTWARRDEIACLRKSEVNRDKRYIDLPPERTKNGVRHVIPLSTQAWALLEPRLDLRPESELVFGAGKGGYSGWNKAVNRLRDALALPHWTLHDFRRTARSFGVRKPVSIFPHIAEAILNHISSVESGKQGVAGVYDVNDPWQYHEEKKEALQKWADYLDTVVQPKPDLKAAA